MKKLIRPLVGLLVPAFLLVLVAASVGPAGGVYTAGVFTGVTVASTGSVQAEYNWMAHDCDGPFSIMYHATSATSMPDLSIGYEVENNYDGSWGSYSAWDGTDSSVLTASTSAFTNKAQGMPFSPPVNAPGRFSITGVGSNPADTSFSLSVTCYKE